MKDLVIILGFMVIAISGIMGLAFKIESNRDTAAENWCKPRGMVVIPIRNDRLCMDPKTRALYYPESR